MNFDALVSLLFCSHDSRFIEIYFETEMEIKTRFEIEFGIEIKIDIESKGEIKNRLKID